MEPKDRHSGESRNPVLYIVFWMPPYQVWGGLLKSGMTDKKIDAGTNQVVTTQVASAV
jgi:hypothetical protein